MIQQWVATSASALQLFATVDEKSKLLGSAAKAGAIAAAIMNTYEGATKALAKLPPPFSFGVAAAVIAAGLANVAIIKKTPVGYREGTRGLDFQDFGSRTPTEFARARGRDTAWQWPSSRQRNRDVSEESIRRVRVTRIYVAWRRLAKPSSVVG